MEETRLNMSQLHSWSKLAIFLITSVLLLSSACALISPAPEPPPPEPENQPPIIHSITAEREVTASTECQISCEADDTDGNTDGNNLNYWWSADGGTIEGEGSSITWVAPDTGGNYTVKLLVTDGKGGEAIDSVAITVTSRPNKVPTISAFNVTPPNKPEVTFCPPGEQISVSRNTTSDIQCIAEDPDGDELSYIWTATGGTVKGEGAIVEWIAPGAAGDYTVTAIVADGRGGKAEASVDFTVLCCGR